MLLFALIGCRQSNPISSPVLHSLSSLNVTNLKTPLRFTCALNQDKDEVNLHIENLNGRAYAFNKYKWSLEFTVETKDGKIIIDMGQDKVPVTMPSDWIVLKGGEAFSAKIPLMNEPKGDFSLLEVNWNSAGIELPTWIKNEKIEVVEQLVAR